MVELLELCASVSIVGLAGCASVSIVGFAGIAGCRCSPVRAATLALKSKILGQMNSYKSTHRLSNDLSSLRISQISELKKHLDYIPEFPMKRQHIVVQGNSGVGKTTLIDTCVEGMNGVVQVEVFPSAGSETVLEQCYNAILGNNLPVLGCKEAKVKRVLYFYKLFFGKRPVLVMKMHERGSYSTGKPAVLHALHILSEMGVSVVVNTEPNLINSQVTNCGCLLNVESFTKDEILNMPQFRALFDSLDKEYLTSVILDMLGGDLGYYNVLFSRLETNSTLDVPDTVLVVVTNFLQQILWEARCEAYRLEIMNRKFGILYTMLKDSESVHLWDEKHMLSKLDVQMASDLFSIVKRNHTDFVVPANQVVALLFKHDCDSIKAFDAICKCIDEDIAGARILGLSTTPTTRIAGTG